MAKKPSKGGGFPKGAPQSPPGGKGTGFALNPGKGMSKPTTPKR